MDTSMGSTPVPLSVPPTVSAMASPYPSTTPAITPKASGPAVEDSTEIDWEKVDKAMEYFANFDVLELAAPIVDKAIAKGPKDIYNEAGPIRYQLAQAKKMLRDLMTSICAESLESKEAKIKVLEKIIQAKQWAESETTDSQMDQADQVDQADTNAPIDQQ